MPRTARIIIPGEPHHVTQRGNRRMQVFFSADDSLANKELLVERAHLDGTPDDLVSLEAITNRIEDWQTCLDGADDDDVAEYIHRHSCSGLPLGSDTYVGQLEIT